MRNMVILFIVSLLSSLVCSDAVGGSAAPVVLVADTRNLNGIAAWCANIYNESRLWFAVLAVFAVPAVGGILGMLADLAMSRAGIGWKPGESSKH
jgi:hypothetical protein